jgi:hypothetical protein
MTYASQPAATDLNQSVSMALVTVFAASAVAYGVAPEITRIPERERAYLSSSPPDTHLLPRFWTHGLINR